MYRFFFFRALFVLLACGTGSCLRAQESPASAAKPAADLSSWQRVQNLPRKTKVHITMDHGGTTCRIFAVSDDTLTCASGLSSSGTGKAIQRSAIKRIKLTRYSVSSVAGLAIGAGAGAAVGAGAVNDTGAFRAVGIAVFSVGGAVAGAVVGGLTDFTRGPTVYVRP